MAAAVGDIDLFPNWHVSDQVKYLVYQIERAPTTGQLHAQGFINLKQSRKLSWLKKLINRDNTAHCEIAHDVPASILYCQKSESRVFGPWEYGTKPPCGQGARMDLVSLWDNIKAGKRTHELLEADPNVARYEKQIKFMRFDALEHLSDRQRTGVTNYVFWGSTRTGKTFTAVNQMTRDHDFFKIDCTSQKGQIWFDGYEGQRVLIIDDFDSSLCSIGYLKVLLDKYSLRLPIKGAHTYAVWDTVIITSNTMPNAWFPDAKPEDQLALASRLHQIRHYVGDAKCIWQEETFNGAPVGPMHADDFHLSYIPAPAPAPGFLQGLLPTGEPLPPPPPPPPPPPGPPEPPVPVPEVLDDGDATEPDEELQAMGDYGPPDHWIDPDNEMYCSMIDDWEASHPFNPYLDDMAEESDGSDCQ